MPEPLWSDMVDDDTYKAWVERTGKYTGRLCCRRMDDGVLILNLTVKLPEQTDVEADVPWATYASWVAYVISAVDADHIKRGEEVGRW